ncbi:MAG TPA: ImmA/IrrE family metallo-endopeptidase [Verrucomicrobiae bacterium]
MTPRPYAARIAAQTLLQRLGRRERDLTREEIVAESLDLAVEEYELKLEQVPCILGNPFYAGRLIRAPRLLQISTNYSLPSRRYTLAHEIGHFLMHTGQNHFCDREFHPDENRPYYEIEADGFAAELLMPHRLLTDQFLARFRAPLETSADQPLFYSLAAQHEVEPREVSRTLRESAPLERAISVATLNSYKGAFFAPLNDAFSVSKMAMGIRLLNLQLVR